MSKNLRFYISPYLLSKLYILRDINCVVKKYKFNGKLLDVGCGQKPYRYIFSEVDNYEGIDFENYSINKDFTANKNPEYTFHSDYTKNFKLQFKEDSYDHTVCFQVLEHHPKPDMLIYELVRITKPNGLILLTVPFLGGLHEEPHDYQRYTKYGLKELFQKHPVKILEIRHQGSLFSTVTLLYMEQLNHFAAKSKLSYIFAVLVYPIFLLANYISLLLDKIIVSDKIVFNYLILVRKN